MVHEQLLSPEERHKWWEIETSIGKNHSQAQKALTNFYRFTDSFLDGEKIILSALIGDTYLRDKPQTFDLTLLRLTLIKKFIEKNKISIIKEYLSLGNLPSKKLEIQMFLHIAKDLFENNLLPENIFTYCKYRKKGNPTTWLKINSQLSDDELITKIYNKLQRLCNILQHRLMPHTHREIRFKLKTNEFYIVLISKPIGVEIIPTEDRALEAQRIAYTTFVLNIIERKIGYVSKSRREVSEVHSLIKKEIYPNSVFSPRTDFDIEDKELLSKLINVNEQEHGLDLIGITFRNTETVNSPSMRLEATNDRPILEAVTQLSPYWQNEGLTNVAGITYLMNGSKIGIYSPEGDEWHRRTISVNTRGKSKTLETDFLNKLNAVLGKEIRETKFVVKQLTHLEIIEKFLFDKAISIDPAIPKKADKILALLLSHKLIKKQLSITKRRCEDWTCHTYSWTDDVCSVCGRDMIVIGEGLTIKLDDGVLLREIVIKITQNLADYEVIRHKMQRNKHKKWVIRITNKRTTLTTYMVPLLEKKDLKFCEALVKENNGLITLNDSHFSSKRDELEAQGINCLSLPEITTNLLLSLENSANELNTMLRLCIRTQEQHQLQRIYQRLHASAENLRNKPADYDEDAFEIDIKNILQALVPNVIRLGAKWKGQHVPDGYCSYRIGNANGYRLFGWDAKYSESGRYSLSSKDYDKQRDYIKWLNNEPEPKAAGKLRIYAFISNFNNPAGFNTVVTRLQSIPEKNPNTKVILLEDMLLANIAEWIMNNTTKVQEHGPEISKVFFKWLGSTKPRRKLNWLFRKSDDWVRLENLLNQI